MSDQYSKIRSEAESLQLMSPARKSQVISSSPTNSNLVNCSSICNGSDTDGTITYTLQGDSSSITEFFPAGVEKLRKIDKGTAISFSTLTKVILFEA